jgi:hypothetical protein
MQRPAAQIPDLRANGLLGGDAPAPNVRVRQLLAHPAGLLVVDVRRAPTPQRLDSFPHGLQLLGRVTDPVSELPKTRRGALLRNDCVGFPGNPEASASGSGRLRSASARGLLGAPWDAFGGNGLPGGG